MHRASYQTQYTDPTSGDVLMQARWYSPGTGNFRSRDTWAGDVNTPVSLNRYTYAYNNPVRYWDPTGFEPEGGCGNNGKFRCPGTNPTPVLSKVADPTTLGAHKDATIYELVILPTVTETSVEPASLGITLVSVPGGVAGIGESINGISQGTTLVPVTIEQLGSRHNSQIRAETWIADVFTPDAGPGGFGLRTTLEYLTSWPIIGDVADFGWCAWDGTAAAFGGSKANAGFSCGAAATPFGTAGAAGFIRKFGNGIELAPDGSGGLVPGGGFNGTPGSSPVLTNNPWHPNTVADRIARGQARYADLFAEVASDPTVGQMLATQRGSVTRAPLPSGSPSWDEVRDLPFSTIRDRAQQGLPGYRTIKKVLEQGRFGPNG